MNNALQPIGSGDDASAQGAGNAAANANANAAQPAAVLPAQQEAVDTLLPEAQLASLPPDVLRRILCTLLLSQRVKLRKSGYAALAEAVAEFDSELLRSVFEVESSREAPSTTGDDAIFDALRREMVDTVSKKRWLDSTSGITNNSDCTHPKDRPCHLRRLTKGDFNAPVDDLNKSTRKYRRENGAYSKAKLIDGHIWVLYSSYWHSFEVYDLDTGRAVDFNPAHAPDRYYVNDEEERMMMCLDAYDGRHGMLAGAMSGGGAAHGDWSGPYVSVWEIETEESLLAIDLYKPNCRVRQVNIVSRDKLVVLLEEADGSFAIQWHRIPKTPIDSDSNPPPPNPPGTRVSSEKRKRPRLERWGSCDSDEEETTSYDYRTKYEWWPCQQSLIKTDQIGRSEQRDALITSDGKGFMVSVVRRELTIWLVSSMEPVRRCQVLDDGDALNFTDNDTLGLLTMHTDVFPIEDDKYDGFYFLEDANEVLPDIRRSGSAQGSSNPIDLTQADTLTILSRFSLITYQEQYEFELGYVGYDNEKNIINRCARMEEGSCSPQLDCVVRVAFVMNRSGRELNQYVFHLDLKPFAHLRLRESLGFWRYDEEMREANLDEYEAACLGEPSPKTGKIGIWENAYSGLQSHEEKNGYEKMHVFQWRRGGVFDFPNKGPCERNREQRIDRKIEDTMQGDTVLGDYPELQKEVHAYNSVEERTHKYRTTTNLFVDSHKLVVSTASEVTILPLALNFLNTDESCETWRSDFLCQIRDEDTLYGMYRIDKDTEVWHSFRPLDSSLLSRWNKIRDFANVKASGNNIYTMLHGTPLPIATLPEPDRVNTIDTITADLAKGICEEDELMSAMESERVSMWFPQLSWRYLAIVSSALTESDNGHERLHVFDILAGWDNKTRSRILKNGIHFHNDLEEGAEEEDSSSDSEGSYLKSNI